MQVDTRKPPEQLFIMLLQVMEFSVNIMKVVQFYQFVPLFM